jgi:hypothetical protein
MTRADAESKKTTENKKGTSYARIAVISVVLGAAAGAVLARASRRAEANRKNEKGGGISAAVEEESGKKEEGSWISPMVENALYDVRELSVNLDTYNSKNSSIIQLCRFCLVARIWDLWFHPYDPDLSQEKLKTLIRQLRQFFDFPKVFIRQKGIKSFSDSFGSIQNRHDYAPKDVSEPILLYRNYSSDYITQTKESETLLFSLLENEKPSLTEREVFDIINTDYATISVTLPPSDHTEWV